MYRGTLVVENLGLDDWQRGALQDWLGSCARWWNIQINVIPTKVLDHQSRPVRVN